MWIGDLHLDKLKKLFEDDAIALQKEEIRKPLEYALTKGIKVVCFAGDIGEHPLLSDDALIALIELIAEYGKALDIHIILGNHDFAENGVHSLRVLELMQRLGFLKCSIYTAPKAVKLEGIVHNFLPHPHKKLSASAAKEAAVNIGHFETSGSIRDNGSKSKSDYTIKDKKSLWLLGHLHTPHTVSNNVFFGGTTYQLNYGESLPKHWLDYKVKLVGGKLKYDVEYVENKPEFRLFNLEIGTLSDLKKIKDKKYYRYKLFVKEGLALPEDVNMSYPQITSISGYKTKKELAALKMDAIIPIEDQSLDKVDIFFGLEDFLRTKGASKNQTKRALKIIQNLYARA